LAIESAHAAGHSVIAIDLSMDPFETSGCAAPLRVDIAALVAEYDHLPLHDTRADLVVFNASLHYSTDIAKRWARRCEYSAKTVQWSFSTLNVRRPHQRPAHGPGAAGTFPDHVWLCFRRTAQRALRHASPLDELAAELDLAGRCTPCPRLALQPRRRIGGLRAGREPAHFPVIVGKRRK